MTRNSKGQFVTEITHWKDSHPTGRKHCTGCRRWRHVVDFGVKKWLDRQRCIPLSFQSRCQCCETERIRKSRGHSPRDWYACGKPGTPHHSKNKYARLRQDPVRLARLHKRQREYARLVRRGGPNPMVDRLPLDTWLDGLSTPHAELARITGLDEKFFRQSHKRIHISLVDKVFTALGRPDLVAVLYGD